MPVLDILHSCLTSLLKPLPHAFFPRDNIQHELLRRLQHLSGRPAIRDMPTAYSSILCRPDKLEQRIDSPQPVDDGPFVREDNGRPLVQRVADVQNALRLVPQRQLVWRVPRRMKDD